MSYSIQFPAYPSPLAGFEGAPPLPEEKSEDGKSLVNPPRADGGLSPAYERFAYPLDNGRRGGLWVLFLLRCVMDRRIYRSFHCPYMLILLF